MPGHTIALITSLQVLISSSVLGRKDIVNMLYLVGLGLADETDITVKGLEIVKRADRVYLEAYTSILLVDKEKLVSPTLCYLLTCYRSRSCRDAGANTLIISRKHTMAALSFWRTARWSNRLATTS